MPSFEEHCAESVRLFGRPFEQVHSWLDEFAGRPPFGMRHRKLRHHCAGVEEARRRWGDEAAAAARAHIVADLEMEGWTEDQPLPRDQDDYEQMRFPVVINDEVKTRGFFF